MIEPETVEINQNYFLNKRLHDLEENLSSKRIKSDTSESDNSIFESINDIEESNTDQSDDNSDVEDDNSNLSTEQSSRCIPVVLNKTNFQQFHLSKHSKKLIKQFKYLYEHSKRKSIDPTNCTNENLDEIKKLHWELRYSFNRIDLLREGYTILSDELFPFYSLCYMCGSMGNDLIYCNSCCQAYHTYCLNESERPHLYPTPESWLCPNCNLCTICGLSTNSQLITCFDCKKIFHIKCLKQSKDEHQYLNLRSQIWFCPLCIKCDCGEKILSNEQNLLSLTKSFSSQQSFMCTNCLNNFKIIRTNKNDQIEKCHLCEKFIEQFITKPKPLFSLSLIGNQISQKPKNLFQCIQCKHRFHPICDGYLNEDIILIPFISINIICSKCDCYQKENIRNSLMNYKIQVVKNTIASITSTLQIMISEDERINNMKRYMSNLQQLHQSLNQSLNLHAFINDLYIIIQRLLDNLDNRQWQAAIDNCIINQCPWFKSSNNNKIILCSTTNTSISSSNIFINRCFLSPSIDHTYSLNNERILFQSNVYKNNLLTSTDSLLRYIDNKYEKFHTFDNLFQIDTRICLLCQTYADHFSSNISRLISIGINQWVHIGCILPAYSKTLNQPPYILHNIHEIINRCQTKLKCDICLKMGASIQCYINDCNAHFHSQCIDIYYSKFDRTLQEKLNLINGLLPNLTTLCLKHNRNKLKNDTDEYESNNDIKHPKLKSIHLSSPVYVDLSNTSIEFSLTNIKLCIGSLQIKSFGNFDYLLDNDPNHFHYPHGYHASRLFWSTKNARIKTIYHLYIDIKQTYHNNKLNHQTKKSIQNLSEFLDEIFQISSRKFSSSNNNSLSSEELIQLYQQWLTSKYGQIKFTIISDDGYKIISDNLDHAWLTIVNLVRDCRDDMNLTHLSMINEQLNGHHIFGLKKSIIKIILNQLKNQQKQINRIILSNNNNNHHQEKKKKKTFLFNSRLHIYQRKSSQRQRFNWLLNPNRTIQYALKTFEIDDALIHARRILLEESSISLRLYHLHYFSQRVLMVSSSSIHGCGLFTLIDLIEGQMIIEYIGEVIRSCLTDKRERENEKKGFGCYMFTVDSMNVIDATHQGNKARFINHNCQPNCFAKTIISSGIKHIIIYALKNISQGSELTYDYSFPKEDIKIPCHCGTSQCRIYLN